jgi:hypothetical protein
MGPEVNDHVSPQWLSYEQLQNLNLRPLKLLSRWLNFLVSWMKIEGAIDVMAVIILGERAARTS